MVEKKKKSSIKFKNSIVRSSENRKGTFFGASGKEVTSTKDKAEVQRNVDLNKGGKRATKFISPSSKKQVTKEEFSKENKATEKREQLREPIQETETNKIETGRSISPNEQLKETAQSPNQEIQKGQEENGTGDKLRNINNIRKNLNFDIADLSKDPKDLVIDLGARALTGGAVVGSAAAFGLSTTAAGILAAAGVVAGVDSTAVWGAADNIASSIPFQLNTISEGMDSGIITRGEAQGLVNQAQKQMDFAAAAVNKSTRINPVLWVANKRYNAIIETQQASLDLRKQVLGLE